MKTAPYDIMTSDIAVSLSMLDARLPLHHSRPVFMQWSCSHVEAMVTAVCLSFHAGLT